MAAKKKSPKAEWIAQARTLSEALPYLRRHAGATFVVKYGGAAMGDPELARLFARDIALFQQVGIRTVVVHGGGPQIGDMLLRLRIKSEFVDGLRVTDGETVEIVEMVLCGSINKAVVSLIEDAGGRAVGLSGKDGGFLRARKLKPARKATDSNIEKVLDLGFVGEPTRVEPGVLSGLLDAGFVPVIAPIGMGKRGETYNINADTAAGAIAAALGARRLLMLTDVVGVLDKAGELLPEMTAVQARRLIREGTIRGGMIPKVETCLGAAENGVDAAVIIHGQVPHALLLEVFTEHGMGTLIRAPRKTARRSGRNTAKS
jgi:acetylglutamate kinase